MSPVLTRPSDARVKRRSDLLMVVGAAIAGVAALLGAFALVRAPDVVTDVTLVNRTGEMLDVDVRGESDGELVALAVLPPRGNVQVPDVVDQGDTWVFEVSREGRALGNIRLTRAQLERDGWRVVLPAQLVASGN
jgi:hypothetical protein